LFVATVITIQKKKTARKNGMKTRIKLIFCVIGFWVFFCLLLFAIRCFDALVNELFTDLFSFVALSSPV
jgi:uncharacterized membrane protein YbhN (UPF0104 family)